jgi:hypothetical protein
MPEQAMPMPPNERTITIASEAKTRILLKLFQFRDQQPGIRAGP